MTFEDFLIHHYGRSTAGNLEPIVKEALEAAWQAGYEQCDKDRIYSEFTGEKLPKSSV